MRGTHPSLVTLDVLLLAFWMGYHDQDGQARCTCISPRVKPPQSPVKSFQVPRSGAKRHSQMRVQADKAPWTVQNHATLLHLYTDNPRISQDLSQLEGTSSHALPRCFSQSSGHYRRRKEKKKKNLYVVAHSTNSADERCRNFSPRSCRDFCRQPFFRAARPPTFSRHSKLSSRC